MGAKNSRRSPGPRRDTQAYYSSSIVPAIEQCMRHPATLLLALLAFVSSTTFCSPIAFIASGCTTMHQQFGSCRLPPISGQIKIFFCLQVNPWRIYSSIVPAVEHVCATCNFHYSFALFPISFSVLFGFCVLNYIFDVATGQDPEMINSATVHRTTIFFVKGQSGKSNASFCSGAFIALGCVQHIHKHLAISSVRIMPLTLCFLRCSPRAPLVEASPRLAHTFSTERRAFKREHSSVPYE
jgi:hypothetical protein